MDNDAKLRKFYGFDEADLYANRNGYLTAKQKAVQKEAERFAEKFMRIGGYVLLILAVVPYIWYALGHGPASLLGKLFWPILSILLVAAAIFFSAIQNLAHPGTR